MAPTDREFDQVLARLNTLQADLTEIKMALAERRGIEAAIKWAVGGGVAGIASFAVTAWHFVRGQ